jgi:hypothetical protein
LTREERFALIVTQVPDLITFEKSFGVNQSGTYTVAADQNAWTYTSGGVTFTYSRVL